MKIFKLVNNRTEIVELEYLGMGIHDNGNEIWRVKNEYGKQVNLFKKEIDTYLYFSTIENAIKVLIQEHCSRIISLDRERWEKTYELREVLNRVLDVTSVEERNNALVKAFELHSDEADILMDGSDKTIRDRYMDVLRNSYSEENEANPIQVPKISI